MVLYFQVIIHLLIHTSKYHVQSVCLYVLQRYHYILHTSFWCSDLKIHWHWIIGWNVVMISIKILLLIKKTDLTPHGLDRSNTDLRHLIFQTVQSNRLKHRWILDSLRSSHTYIFLLKSHPTNPLFLSTAFWLFFCPPSSQLLSVKPSSFCVYTDRSITLSVL